MEKTQKSKVEEPETEDRDRSKQIKAHVGAAWLHGVTVKSVLFVTKEREAGQEEDEQTENQHQYPPGFACNGDGEYE